MLSLRAVVDTRAINCLMKPTEELITNTIPVFHSGKILDERYFVNRDVSRAFLNPYPCSSIFAVTWSMHKKTNKSFVCVCYEWKIFFIGIIISVGFNKASQRKVQRGEILPFFDTSISLHHVVTSVFDATH